MLVRRSVPAVLTATATLSALLVVPASAEPEWTPPTKLDTSNTGVTAATNGTGDTVAVWESGSRVKVAYRRNAGAWSAPRAVPADDASVAVAMDRRRNTVLAWAAEGECWREGGGADYVFETPIQDYRLHVAFGGPTGRWTRRALTGSWDGCHPTTPAAVVDRDGVVTVAWVGYRGRPYVSQRLRNGRWTPSRALSSDSVSQIQAAIGAGGKAVLVWADGTKAWSTSSTAPGRWSKPQALVSTGGSLRGIVLDADPVGNLGLAYVTTTGSSQAGEPDRIGVRLRPSGARRWQGGETVGTGRVEAARELDGRSVPALSLGIHDGAATVAWFENISGPSSMREDEAVVMTSSRRPGGKWSVASARSAPMPSGIDGGAHVGWEAPALAVSERGAVLAWRRPEGKSARLERAMMTPSGAWTEAETVATRADLGPLYSSWRGLQTVVAPQRGLFTHVFLADDGVRVSDNVSDRTAPTVHLARPKAAVSLTGSLPVSWVARDELTGVRGVDVRLRSAGRNGRFSRWTMWRDDTTAKAGRFATRPGRTYCVSARATDRAGNTGRWSRQRCVAAPVDDRALRASAGWQRARSKAAYQRTLTVTSRRGARLVLGGVRAKRLSLVAATCPRCGTVEVRHGGRLVGTVDLSSRKPRHKRVFTLPGYRGLRSGKVVVRVTSTGEPVRIDGIATSAG